jgi:DNA replication protein DnaC
MKKFVPCEKCKKLNSSGLLPEGFFYKRVVQHNKTFKVVKECECHKQWIKEREIYSKYIKAGLKKSDFEYDINSYLGNKSKENINRIIKYIENFSQTKSSLLYCWGPYNSQKTTIMYWIGHQALSQGYSVNYVLFNELLKNLWDSQRKEELSELVENYKNCDLLIIDEAFDSKKASVWSSDHQIALVDELIRNRINSGKGIIFCTNVNPKDISKNIHSEAIQNIIFRETKKNDSILEFNDCLNSINTIPEKLF